MELPVFTGGFEHAFGAEELFLDVAVAGGVFDGDEPAFEAIGVFVDDVVVVGIPIAVGEGVAETAAADGAEGVLVAGKPVEDIDAVAILFDDGAAGEGIPEGPAAEFLFVGGEVLVEFGVGGGGQVAEDPIAFHEFDVADAAGGEVGVGFAILGAEALLEAELDALGGVAFFPGAEHALAAGDIGAGGFFAVDVFAGGDGGFEVFGVEEDGGGDEDGIDVGVGEELLVVAVGAGLGGGGDFGFGGVDAVGEFIAEGGEAALGALGHESADVLAAAARADDAEVDGGIGLVAEGGGRGDDKGGSAEEGATVHGLDCSARRRRVRDSERGVGEEGDGDWRKASK